MKSKLLLSLSKDHFNKILISLFSFQNYIESLANSASVDPGGEDSSYDSDGEPDRDVTNTSTSDIGNHAEVSRTTSDTLAAEYAEYVSPPGYAARVEFALKLGYTERLVQAALHKLGTNPGQNELLAELIKLGARGPLDQSPSLELSTASDTSAVDKFEETLYPGSGKLRPIVIDGSNVAMR